MKLFPTMTTYGKWIAISNPSYPDGCELLTADEFAEQSEHIIIETDADVGAHYTNEAVACDEFSGFAEYAPQHSAACDPIGQGCIAGCTGV